MEKKRLKSAAEKLHRDAFVDTGLWQFSKIRQFSKKIFQTYHYNLGLSQKTFQILEEIF